MIVESMTQEKLLDDKVDSTVVPTDEVPKRRRGRPPKDPELQTQTVGIESTEKVKRKYTKRTKTIDPEAMVNLAKQLQGIHLMAASMLKIPEIQINESEAVALAQSLQTVSMEYNLSLTGKTGATIQLMATCAMIYLPRMKYINEKFKKSKPHVVTAESVN